MPNDDKSLATYQPALSRRRFIGTSIGATVGALVLPLLPTGLLAAEPASAGIGEDALYALSQKLVGGGDLARSRVSQLATLLASQPALKSGAAELIQLKNPASAQAQNGLSKNGHSACTNILTYWYQGMFDGQPVEQRSSVFFSLPAWGTVGYFTQPTMCKGYGYWAQDVTSNSATAGASA